jgi:hypothetical protein
MSPPNFTHWSPGAQATSAGVPQIWPSAAMQPFAGGVTADGRDDKSFDTPSVASPALPHPTNANATTENTDGGFHTIGTSGPRGAGRMPARVRWARQKSFVFSV